MDPILQRAAAITADDPSIRHDEAVNLALAEHRRAAATLRDSVDRALTDDAVATLRDGVPSLPGLEPTSLDPAIAFKRGRAGGIEVDLAATTKRIMRDRPFLSHVDAQNEAVILARGLRGKRAPDPVLVLARDLADAGIRSDDAQIVAQSIVRSGNDVEQFDCAVYADARAAGTDHMVAMKSAWEAGARTIALSRSSGR